MKLHTHSQVYIRLWPLKSTLFCNAFIGVWDDCASSNVVPQRNRKDRFLSL